MITKTKEAKVEKKKPDDDWMTRKWRPMMAIMYMFCCLAHNQDLPHHQWAGQHLAYLRQTSANPAARIIHQAQTHGVQPPSWAAAQVDINPDMVQHHHRATTQE